MKIVGKKNIKIIAATSMAIFSLLACFSATYAWFTAMRQVSKDADDFAVVVKTGKLKNIYFHKFASKTIDPNTLEASSFTFNSAYDGKISYDWDTNEAHYDGDTSIDLPDYSPLDPAHPLLMVFELDQEYSLTDAGEILISAKTDVEFFLGARTSTNAPAYNLKTTGVYHSEENAEDPTKTDYYYALSSVVNFYCTDSASELYNKVENENTTLINTTYTVANLRSRDDSIAAKQDDPTAVVPDLSFTNVNNANDTISFNQEPSIYTSLANTSVRYISIIIDYYADAVEYIYSTYLGNEILETEFLSELHFLCDWGLEVR